uniref:Uncharacterized protein n=1 Tax=Romanomermis culicivorax TaxID=13658 RepID=A0A915HPG9_ROMCU
MRQSKDECQSDTGAKLRCTHFTWTNEHGCLPKHSKTKQEALETKRWHSYAKCGMVESRFSSHGDDEETTTITTAEFTSGTDAATEIGTPTDISALQTETEEVVSHSTAAAIEISTPTDVSVPQSETEEMISDVTAAATEISASTEESTPQA